MQPLQGEHNRSHPGELTVAIQARWSRQRCWPGEELTLSVRTSRVKDGAQIELAIVPAGDDRNPLDTVSGQTVKDSKLDHKYPIDWKQKPLGENRKFVISPTLEKKLKGDPSPALYVDLEPPIFSA
jgi:hypothetical protein